LVAVGRDVDTDYYVLQTDGSTEAYQAGHEANYKHSTSEPDRPGRYVQSVSDDLADGSTVQWLLEDAAGNAWSSKTMYWDGTDWHNLPADAAAAKTAAEAVNDLTKEGGDGDLAEVASNVAETLATALDAVGVRMAIGMAEANLDTQLSAIGSVEGSGARTLTITVTDGTDALEGAKIRMTKAAESYVATTYASGQITVGRDDGTWTVAITLAGYTFVPTTLVVTADDSTIEYEMVQQSFTASDPGFVTGYLYCYDENGEVEAGVLMYSKVKSVSGSGVSYDNKVRSVTSDVSGLAEFTNMSPGMTYQIRRGDDSEWEDVTVLDSATSPYALDSIVGSDE
jgi:hypothetical protein